MKALLPLVVMLAVLSLPASVQSGSNQVDLDGKGLSHQSPAGKETLRSGQQATNGIGAAAGRKAMDDLETQQRQNQKDMARSWDHMNQGKNLQNPWKTSVGEQKSSSGKGKKSSGKKGKPWQVNHK